jgi:hypothetical protein
MSYNNNNKKSKTMVVNDDIAGTTTHVDEPKDEQPVATPAAIAAGVTMTLEEAVPVVVHPQFMVMKTAKVSYYGQMITLHEGEVLDSSGYSMAGIARLRDAGVELEEVK